MNAHIPLVEPHGAANTQKPQSHEAGAPQLAKRAGLALIRWRDGLPAWACVLAGLALALITWAARSAVFGDSPKMPYATFYPMVSLAALCGPPLLGATATLTAAALVLVTVAPLQGGDDVAALVLFVLNSALTVGLAEFLTRLWSDRMTQTARTHALEQLKSSIVDSSDDAIITKTLDGRISSWNPAATRILGYSAQEMIGQPVTRLFPPQDIGQESAILAHLRAGGRARHYQTRRIAKDGRAIDVALTISPLRDDQGRVIGASKILRDITRQKASEDALRASEARLRFALEGARAAAWQWDVPTMTSSWEPHFFALHGVDLTREPSFAAWLESVVEEDRAGAEQAARAALTPGAPDFHCEYRVRAKAGGPRWLEIFGRVERDADGAPLRMSGISRDITERRAALEAAEAAVHDLARANESLKKFSYIAAHDLQEPLRKIQQFSDLLMTECGGDVSIDAVYYLKVLRESAERSRMLIYNLLEFSRAANRELRMAPVDMEALMGRVVKTCAGAIAETSAEVRVASLPPLTGDEALVEQVFINMLTNALKYRRPGVAPLITLSAVPEDGRTVFLFSDNGVGIARDDGARVFEPFVRLRDADGIKGAGIGLAICQTICDRHGWRISLESEPDAGATFAIAVPADNAARCAA
jgi:PAS domain S-box-containing protein